MNDELDYYNDSNNNLMDWSDANSIYHADTEQDFDVAEIGDEMF